MATAMEVAQWMVEELEKYGELSQEDAAFDIAEKFGDEFVYDNENDNLAISKPVLAQFRKLTEKTVVWYRRERCWYKRMRGDDPTRQQE